MTRRACLLLPAAALAAKPQDSTYNRVAIAFNQYIHALSAWRDQFATNAETPDRIDFTSVQLFEPLPGMSRNLERSFRSYLKGQ